MAWILDSLTDYKYQVYHHPSLLCSPHKILTKFYIRMAVDCPAIHVWTWQNSVRIHIQVRICATSLTTLYLFKKIMYPVNRLCPYQYIVHIRATNIGNYFLLI